ncbi:response regulator [Actinoplanes sp. NPDC051633]|uniref:response regulator n=1 Tax=Actinoplanes sp. NPDC051633 TaxID=3155670 RepID=UPI00341D7457
MAQQWALAGNVVIAVAYAAICMAILVPLVRAGQLCTNRLAVATALIFFSCAVGHALHAAMYWQSALTPNHQIHDVAGWSLWPTAVWDVATALVGIYYWTLRRSYAVLLGGTGALFVDPAEERRRHDIELRERVAEGRAEAEAERDAQAGMLSAIIANSQSLIYVKDLDGRYLLANTTFEQAFGLQPGQILGNTDDLIEPALADTWRAADIRAHHEAIHVEEADSRGRIYESNKFPLHDANGELFAVCGVSLDVTDLRQATRNVEQARDEALAQSRVKSEFLATMSHEIRTPMNGVLGLAGLLMSTDLDPAQRRYATGIHTAGNALLGVINDILDFSKIEAGKIVLDAHDFDLAETLAETAALIAPAADEKGLTLVTRRGPGLPGTVRGDGGRVRQILINLAGNAVKFTGRGSVTLRADLIPTRPGADAVIVRFEVTDTGIGITADDAGRLFEPFTQADASTTRTYGGTGLGLAISRQLTEAMGGTIGVDSEPGQGSTFWCEIPFETATGDPTCALTTGPGLRILLAGSGPDHAALEDDLRRWGMTVTTIDTAADAPHTLRDAATHGRHYDLLLLDADPGDVDTTGLARLVTDDEDIPAVHVIVLNENPPAGDHGTGIGIGTPTYLPKPVHRSALYDLLAQSMAAVVPVPVAPSTRPAVPAVPAAARGRILLVEDNDINQMVATGILTGLGYETDVANDGVEACEMYARREYDAILMDCRMPRMDGFTATAEIRRTSTRHIPIIAMTASALVADRERCLAAGMDDYLTKPVNPAELDETLTRWVAAGTPFPQTPSPQTPSPQRPSPVRVPADPIGRRLAELAGDGSEPEVALVRRLVGSFLNRAPRHVSDLDEAYRGGDLRVVEDVAHSLKGAAGNIGAVAVQEVCGRIEDCAREGRLPTGVGDDLRTLRLELDRAAEQLQEVVS